MRNSRLRERCRRLGVAIWSFLAVVAVLFIARRLFGHFHAPIPPSLASLWGVLIAASSIAAAHLYRCGRRRFLPLEIELLLIRAPHVRQVLPDVIAIAVGIAATVAAMPAASPVEVGNVLGLWCLFGAFVAFQSWADELQWRMEPLTPVAAIPTPAATSEATGAAPLIPPSVTFPTLAARPEEMTLACLPEEDDSALQTMTRRLEEGFEVVEGSLQVDFDEAQRDLSVHVAFVPPLSQVPEVELEDLDGQEWELKVAAAFPFGLRLMIRRREGAATSGQIGYRALAAAADQAA